VLHCSICRLRRIAQKFVANRRSGDGHDIQASNDLEQKGDTTRHVSFLDRALVASKVSPPLDRKARNSTP
jgi:hypothetical protein